MEIEGLIMRVLGMGKIKHTNNMLKKLINSSALYKNNTILHAVKAIFLALCLSDYMS